MFKKSLILCVVFFCVGLNLYLYYYQLRPCEKNLESYKGELGTCKNDLDECLKHKPDLKKLTNFYPNIELQGDVMRIGLNYPETGPYSVQGLAQLRAARMAVDEINAQGGISGRKIELVIRDSKSKGNLAKTNVEELIDNEKCEMIFGGSASSVAIAGGKAAKSRGKLYFGTLTYSNETTGKEKHHEYMFRECYNAWMGANVLSNYLKENFFDRTYFYITADYTWGKTTEQSIREFSNTLKTTRHKGILTPFPTATEEDFKKALEKAEEENAEVLVLVLFGKDMSKALSLATEMGLKERMEAVIVPNLTLGMAQSAGPRVMEDVIGALPWCWQIPYKYNPICIRLRVSLIFENPVRRGFAVWDSQGAVV